MADGFTIDAAEVDQLSAAFGAVPNHLGWFLPKAVEVSARHVKDGWRDETKGIAQGRAFPFSITYDMSVFQGFGVSVVQAEIGPDKGRAQGPLGNLIEYGGDTKGGLMSNRGAGAAEVHEAAADFERGLAQATADAERAAGVDASLLGSAGAVVRGSYL